MGDEVLENQVRQAAERLRMGLMGLAVLYEGLVHYTQVPEVLEVLKPDVLQDFASGIGGLEVRAKQLREACEALEYFQTPEALSYLQLAHERKDLFDAVGKVALGLHYIRQFIAGKSAIPPSD